MNANTESEHVDMLLALALAFGDGEGERAREGGEAGVLSALAPPVRQAVERRAEWYARLTRQKQLDWLGHMLGRARSAARLPRLDEHVHPSHVVEALDDEPPRVRELVVRHLPPALASSVAAELGIAHTPSDESSARSSLTDASAGPSPEIVAVVGREFLSRFVTLAELERVTPVEVLTGAELARLVRLLGVRETARACRGIERVEAVASFLRGFAPEDARAVAAHIASLTEVEPTRVRFAEQVVREALLAEPEPAACLDRVGLRLLALALSGDETGARLRYTAQKLPVEAARWLEESTRAESPAAATTGVDESEVASAVAREAEVVAGGLHRGRRTRTAGAVARRKSNSPAGGV
ncbi:MAG TPA: hypothetical protein VFX96_02915 [Pyrinomonadaceae bacterium]|nr:hypothetical protein [Pyrinomonadaceae bacterium]